MATKEEHLKVLKEIFGKKVLLTIDDLVELLGCAKQTIYNDIKSGVIRGGIPIIKVGDLVRVSIIDVANFFAQSDLGEQPKKISPKDDRKAKLQERAIYLFQHDMTMAFEKWNAEREKNLLLDDLKQLPK